MKIVSTISLSEAQRKLVLDALPGLELVDRQCTAPAEISDMVRGGCDILLTFVVPDDLLQAAPRLRWIQLVTAGVDHMMSTPAYQSAVHLTTTSGVHAASLGEFVIAMMLMFVHRFHVTTRAQMRHQWLPPLDFMKNVDSLRGKTIGIAGYGSIGRELARQAQAFGMEIVALKREPKALRDTGWSPAGVGDPEGRIPRRIYGPEERDTMLRESDFVVLILPLTEQTRHFIGERELGLMKPTAMLINVGRGGLIDEAALIRALNQKRIASAGLDVYEREPLPESSPLWDMESVIMTPHIAGPFRRYFDLTCELFAENLRRFNSGAPLLNEIDRKLGY